MNVFNFIKKFTKKPEVPELPQTTLVLIKPDGIVKSLTGNIISRLSESKLCIVGSKVVKVSRQLAEAHYHELVDKPFFEDLLQYIQGKIYGPEYERVIAMVYQGQHAIRKVRDLAGSTNPEQAAATTIRGSYGRITTKGVFENVIHASSSPEDAEREIKLWFKPSEIVEDLYPTKTIMRSTHEEEVWA